MNDHLSSHSSAGLSPTMNAVLAGPGDSALGYLRRFVERARIPDAVRAANGNVVFPTVYSYIDDPDAALRVAVQVAAAAAEGVPHLHFDQRGSSHVDLCAESVSCALAKQAAMGGVAVDGDYPYTPTARAAVAAFGVPAVLEGFVPEPTSEQALIPLQRGAAIESALPDYGLEQRTLLAEQLPHLIGRYIGGRRLEKAFADYLAALVSACVDNAAEHGEGDWWVAASLRREESNAVARCQLTVFNFGESMHQSILRPSSDSSVRQEFEPYAKYHQVNNTFSTDWTEECFWTLVALQPRVSRRWRKVGRTGTDRILRFFNYAAQTAPPGLAPRVSIISGGCQVLLGPAAALKVADVDRASHITFNASNDLRCPPDRRVVHALKGYFPGTLISTHFFVSEANIQRSANHNERRLDEEESGSGPRARLGSRGEGLRRLSVG